MKNIKKVHLKLVDGGKKTGRKLFFNPGNSKRLGNTLIIDILSGRVDKPSANRHTRRNSTM